MLQGQPGSILGTILGAKWEAKGAKMPPNIELKIDEIWSAFFDEISIAKSRILEAFWDHFGAQNPLKMH